jgi:predicted permease
MNDLWQDVKYGARMLAKSPGFTAIAVVTLALGIGLNAAVFSVVNAVLVRPLPVHSPHELAGIYNHEPNEFMSHVPMSYLDYTDLRDQNKSFSGVVAYALTPFAFEKGEETHPVIGEFVSGNYFSVLGINAVVGRTFTAEEDTAPHLVAVLSHAAWERRFGSDRGIVGQTVRLNGHPVTIVGVAAPGFSGVLRVLAPELWVPLAATRVLRVQPTVADSSREENHLLGRRSRWLWVMARLKPRVTHAQADAEVRAIGASLKHAFPESNKDRDIAALPASDVKIIPGVDRVLYATSFVLLAVVGLVLLIACANVANMLLARAAARRKEVAVRLSLGAGRARLVRQLLTENLLLSLAGGMLGLVIAYWSNAALNAFRLPLPVQLSLGLSVDGRVLAFTLIACVLTTLTFGLAPALQASKTDLATTLKEESRSASGGRGRLRSTLVVMQVALSLVLLIAAGLSVRSMWNAHRVHPGFEAVGVVVAEFEVGLRGLTNEQGAQFYRQLAERVRALPGVQSVGYCSHTPLSFSINLTSMAAEGADTAPPDKWAQYDTARVGAGYFETMRVPLLRGRSFLATDSASAPNVVVVNESLAARFWPGQQAIGRRMRVGSGKEYYQVIGVARDGKYRTLGEDSRPFAWTSIEQGFEFSQVLLARVSGDPRTALAAIRAEARQLDSKAMAVTVQTLEESISVSLLFPRMGAGFFGLFGLLGLALATVGLYGVIAYTVSQRTHEIGIRMALGAARGDVLRLVVGQGLRLTVFGLALGLAGALAATRLIAVLLYGISPTDVTTFVAVSATLLASAALACYLPARRAAATDPMVALRYE